MTWLDLLATGSSLVTAVLGLVVAGLAFRGYRRNDSATMRALAAGVLAIAVIPYLFTTVFAPLVSLTDAQALLGITLSHTLGLLAIYRTFDSNR
jgi:fatty acid desaturase